MQYCISKKEYKGIIYKLNVVEGYSFTPKNKLKDCILVSRVSIKNISLIKNILKKKIRFMLENIDSTSDSDSRKALDQMAKFRSLINEKYKYFLDSKYISLLNQKLDILSREFNINVKREQSIEQKRFEQYLYQKSLENETLEKEESKSR